MKIFINNTFYDKFNDSPTNIIKNGYISVGFDEGGSFSTGFVQSPLKYRMVYPTAAHIYVKEYLNSELKFVEFVCISDYGTRNSVKFFIFVEQDYGKVMQVVKEFKKAIIKYRLDGSISRR